MAQIEGGHVDDRVGAVPGPDSVNRRVTGPGTEPGSVPGLVRLKWAMCIVNGAIVASMSSRGDMYWVAFIYRCIM